MKKYSAIALIFLFTQAGCTLAANPPSEVQAASAPTATTTSDTRYATAIAAYQRGDFATAMRELKPLAEQGDATAQNNLAVLYQDGLGVPVDIKQALHWYEKAAAQGLAEAQFMAGLLHSDGIGVPQNYERAVYWYTQAAEQNHPEAQNNLAARYATGSGVARNLPEAMKWYERAAQQGHPTAGYTLKALQQEFSAK